MKFKCFEVLIGEKPVSTITSRLTDSHISVVTKEYNWFGAVAGVNW